MKNQLNFNLDIWKSEVSDILDALYVACECLDNFKDTPKYVRAMNMLEEFGYYLECTAEENKFLDENSRRFTME
jgi:hypothetical protein